MQLLLAAAAHSPTSHGFWWHIGRIYGDITGADNESGKVYGSWSGFWGALQPTLLITAVVFYWKHTCHEPYTSWYRRILPSCWRWAHTTVTNAQGVTYRICHKHHPDHPDTFTHEDLVRAVRENALRNDPTSVGPGS